MQPHIEMHVNRKWKKWVLYPPTSPIACLVVVKGTCAFHCIIMSPVHDFVDAHIYSMEAFLSGSSKSQVRFNRLCKSAVISITQT